MWSSACCRIPLNCVAVTIPATRGIPDNQLRLDYFDAIGAYNVRIRNNIANLIILYFRITLVMMIHKNRVFKNRQQ